MRRQEAVVIGQWIRDLRLPPGAVCLNIGSSTKAFRTLGQPHIEEFLFAPLERAGVRVLHCDMKPDEGVDLVGDVLDPAFQDRLGRVRADLLLCSNLLEHLSDPGAFARACGRLVKPGGFGLFTVPSSYPFHPDPIDTLYRPSPEQLARLLPDWAVVRAEAIDCGSFGEDLRNSGRAGRRLARHLLRVLMPLYRPRQWRSPAHRLLWLVRRYRQTALLLRKPAA